MGSRGTLKSPPRIKRPSWKVDSSLVSVRKNGTWEVLGLYMFARVIGLFLNVPLRKMNLPCSSINVSVICKGIFLERSIETPFVFEAGEVA